MARSLRIGAALALCCLACSPHRARLATVADLAALFPAAEVHREVGTIDFGTAEARSHLESGWYSNERGADGASFVWSKGEVSLVQFFLAAPRDLRAELRCAPLPAGGPPQELSVEVNGRRLRSLELAPGMRGYAVELPGAALRAGINRLAFAYRTVSEPGRDNGHRRLAVQWDALRFVSLRQPGAAAPRREGAGLYLPFGTEVVYYLSLDGQGKGEGEGEGEGEAEAELALAGVAGRGSGEGRLTVTAQEESGGAAAREVEPGPAAHEVELPGRGARLLRLGLRATAAAEGADGGLLVLAPTVRTVRAAGRRQVARAAGAPPLGRPGPLAPQPPRPNVILYLVDTLRADRLGCYGAAGAASPELDAFARGATLFERAVAQAPWTRPSVASVLTGLGPLSHGVTSLDDKLPPAAVTLPEMLQAAGYRTAGFSTNPQVSAGTGLAQGFDDFDLLPDGPRSDAVNRRVLRWLDGKRTGAPFFLYVHTIDPHAPYDPPPGMLARFAPGVRAGAGARAEIVRAYASHGEERAHRVAQLAALYAAEVAWNAQSFGELLAALRRRGLYDSALVVFVADHGEEFDEHGELGHAKDLYGETLDVPLIVKWPHQTRGVRVSRLAQHVDLLPTILRAAGLPPSDGLPGSDLRALAAAPSGAPEPAGREILSHLSYEGREEVSLVDGDWKLIVPLSRRLAPEPELYRRDADPGERVNLVDRDGVRAGWLLQRIRLALLRAGGRPAAERAPIDEETRRALGALGYL